MMRTIILGVLVVTGACAGAQPRDAAVYPISTAQVVQALSRAGIHVASSQVYRSTEDRAASSNPALDLLDMEPGPQRDRVWARMGCHERQQCRPFYVSVSWKGPLPAIANPEVAQKKNHTVAFRPPIIRFGDHAMLIVDDPRLHMEIAVVALQNGAIGQVIHLATPDRKQFYQGEVVNKFTLKGSL